MLVCILLYELASSICPRAVALGAGLLVALSGNMIWFALSGMETMLFLALGMSALMFYRQQRLIVTGITLGLLALIRPEGLALTVVLVLLELLRHRGWRRELWGMIIPCLLVCGPWFAYLLWRTGHVLPTSATGKRISFQAGIEVVTGNNPGLAKIAQFSPVFYAGGWIVYLILFAFGGMALPGPRLPAGALVGNPNYAISIWAILGVIGIILPLLVAAGKHVWAARWWKPWLQEPDRRAIAALASWGLLHNLSYMVFIPVPGTASRYGALNYPLIWLGLLVGQSEHLRHHSWGRWLLPGLFLIGITNTLYWNSVYDANLEHMQDVRIAAARYVREQIPPSAPCAVFDLGAIRYFSKRPIVDLGGLIDPDMPIYFQSGTYDRYLLDQNVTCLLLPGRMNTAEDGWFDMARVMGLDTSLLIELQQIAVFEIDHERWLHGYLPTNNYQASVTIYQVAPRSQD